MGNVAGHGQAEETKVLVKPMLTTAQKNFKDGKLEHSPLLIVVYRSYTYKIVIGRVQSLYAKFRDQKA